MCNASILHTCALLRLFPLTCTHTKAGRGGRLSFAVLAARWQRNSRIGRVDSVTTRKSQLKQFRTIWKYSLVNELCRSSITTLKHSTAPLQSFGVATYSSQPLLFRRSKQSHDWKCRCSHSKFSRIYSRATSLYFGSRSKYSPKETCFTVRRMGDRIKRIITTNGSLVDVFKLVIAFITTFDAKRVVRDF
jgi:hypothetical protein